MRHFMHQYSLLGDFRRNLPLRKAVASTDTLQYSTSKTVAGYRAGFPCLPGAEASLRRGKMCVGKVAIYLEETIPKMVLRELANLVSERSRTKQGEEPL